MNEEKIMCHDDRSEIAEFKSGQELEHGDPVKDKAGEQDREQFAGGEVFIQQDDIIPEIQEGFLMVMLGQGASPNMING